jgi:hypothetical protein
MCSQFDFISAAADTDKLVDDTVCTIFGFAERTIDRSSLTNPERRCPDCPGWRTKRGLMCHGSPFIFITAYYLLSRTFQEALGWKRSLKDYISLNGDKVKGLS